MKYLLDTNIVTYLIERHPQVWKNYREAELRGDTLLLCQPVIYEIERGLRWRGAAKKLATFRNSARRVLAVEPLTDDDWLQAAQFWAETRKQGRQLSDMDLLVAAITHRLDATLVTNDEDFAILSVRRENWEQA
ncbi:MAG: PIN domain-containing protein [Anaerolineae bacterium]|nr:PIN domain-containing protein [Anaerolineae bacterium]